MSVELLDRCLRSDPTQPDPPQGWDAWFTQVAGIDAGNTIERAFGAGFAADRLAYAFAAGYQCALRCLLPIGWDRTAVLCVSEEGGGHPKAIQTTLKPIAATDVTPAQQAAQGGFGGWNLLGQKKWASMASAGADLFVLASAGESAGRKRLKLVRVGSDQPGVVITPMPPTPFIPEVPHATLRFDVQVADEAILPGDGFADYVRAFRVLEDAHVGAACAAHLLRMTLSAGDRSAELVACCQSFVSLDPDRLLEPSVILRIGGAMSTLERLLGSTWSVEPAVSERWLRDKLLLTIGGKVRERLHEKAWAELSA